MFGDPAGTQLQGDGGVIWEYMLQSQHQGLSGMIPFHHSVNAKVKTLQILFDKNGVVKTYSFSNSNVGAKSSSP